MTIDPAETALVPGKGHIFLSVIFPTYNESQNILKLLDSVRANLPSDTRYEIIIVDDNSPDGTGELVENYIQDLQGSDSNRVSSQNCTMRIIHRQKKEGLISALLDGIRQSSGSNILIMDSDFSHPPELIPRFMDELQKSRNSLVVGSRYANGGLIKGWPLKRRIISRCAVKLAAYVLRLNDVKDPISGFFAFPATLSDSLSINSKGYKILLEILIKNKNSDFVVKEIPYTFVDRKRGTSKTDYRVILDYAREIWYLYRCGFKTKNIDYQAQV